MFDSVVDCENFSTGSHEVSTTTATLTPFATPFQTPSPTMASWWSKLFADYPIAKRRTLIRRHLDCEAAYNLTIDRGRPDRTVFTQCGSRKCRNCGYSDFSLVADVCHWDKNGNQTSWREDLFFDAMVSHLWGSVPDDERDKAEKRRCVESFVYSPPVRGAFAQFSIYMEGNDRNMKDDTSSIAITLTKHRDMFKTYLQALRNRTLPNKRGHWRFFKRSCDLNDYPFHWTIDKFVVQFLLIAESWRSFAVKKQGAKMWDFPGAADMDKLVDFLSAVFLNFIDMRDRRSVNIYAYDPVAHSHYWAEWDDKYQVFTEELKRRTERRAKWSVRQRRETEARMRRETLTEEELKTAGEVVRQGKKEGEECLEGYGKGADEQAWKTKRILASQGHSVPGYKP